LPAQATIYPEIDVTTSPPSGGKMPPTDTKNPDYFHRVVDCQWACPAHTDVPGYIRLIAQGKYTEAYMLNRESNVFPGILGRVCDRPCEPACRRGRVEEKPVAICRLKRVAADLADDYSAWLPKPPAQKNGKRVACIGAGPASLTVANDLLPLGYEVVIFEGVEVPGGLMRSNIPSFRLPADVLDREIGDIIEMGADLRLGQRIESMRKLLGEGFDAIFVGTGAPNGKELKLPGRDDDPAHVHIGIAWLESVAFEHIKSIGEKVLIIGVGNTAMDCCRTSMRLGAKSVKVMARKPRQFFKASPWELEDAEEETSRSSSTVRPRPSSARAASSRACCSTSWNTTGRPGADHGRENHRRGVHAGRRRRARHRPGKRIPVDRARSRHRVRQVERAGRRQADASTPRAPGCFRRRCRIWPEEHHLGRRAGSPGCHLRPQVLPGRALPIGSPTA
jgi:NADPH-dependent glutamate synthase beta subunit-like oxidoreductase